MLSGYNSGSKPSSGSRELVYVWFLCYTDPPTQIPPCTSSDQEKFDVPANISLLPLCLVTPERHFSWDPCLGIAFWAFLCVSPWAPPKHIQERSIMTPPSDFHLFLACSLFCPCVPVYCKKQWLGFVSRSPPRRIVSLILQYQRLWKTLGWFWSWRRKSTMLTLRLENTQHGKD